MPTGYTHNVPKGISFEEFVMQCARAMGALIMMRDEPANAEIPESFEPSNYHIERLAELNIEHKRLRNLTFTQRQEECEAEWLAEEDTRKKHLAKTKKDIDAYKDMLKRVRAWTPPTEDHMQFKLFMIEQLESSIKFDDTSKFYSSEVERIDTDDWFDYKREKVLKDIAYHHNEHQKEVDRTESRNQWLHALRESLK